MHLYYQKLIFVLFVLITNLLLLFVFVIYPKLYCKEYSFQSLLYSNNNSEFVEENISCNIIKYSLFGYYILTLFVLILTLIASYYIKFFKTKNPKDVLPFSNKSNILVFIPAYSENKDSLKKTLDSVVLNNYESESKCICLVVDGKIKGKDNDDYTYNYAKEILNTRINMLDSNNKNELYIGLYKNVRYILIVKKENKGKKDSFLIVQKLLYYNYMNEDAEDNLYYKNIIKKFTMCDINVGIIDYVLMLDTDTIVEASSIKILADYLDSNPSTLAVCGETSITNTDDSLLSASQYFEYYITHYSLKSLESVYGDVLVLSGCFSLYRKNVLINKELINFYENERTDSLYWANITKLGEDRLLTNLLLKYYPQLNAKYTNKAICYTDAPNNLNTLLCQRRRWTNSLIFCNLFLLLNLPKYALFKRFRFFTIILLELWIVLYMPLLLTIGYYYIIIFFYKWSLGYYDLVGIIQTFVLLCFPIIMCIILRELKMIFYAFIFILTIPIFSIVIPIYSIYCSDYVKWGNTRRISEDSE